MNLNRNEMQWGIKFAVSKIENDLSDHCDLNILTYINLFSTRFFFKET